MLCCVVLFHFVPRGSDEDLLLRVMDWNRMSKDKAIGTVRVNLGALAPTPQELSLPVISSAGAQASPCEERREGTEGGVLGVTAEQDAR